jgi:hypothetical protein
MPDSGHDRFGGLTDGVLALVPVRRTRCGETSAFPWIVTGSGSAFGDRHGEVGRRCSRKAVARGTSSHGMRPATGRPFVVSPATERRIIRTFAGPIR